MRISVAMTTYNGASFLREQLDSILAETRLPDELIVCDDQSSDATPGILEDYARKSPFPMQVVINQQRLGSTKNFEKAIGLCSGDLIALCDQDDVWRPEKLATVERKFEDDPDLGLVFTNADLIDDKSVLLANDAWTKFRFHDHRGKVLDDVACFDLLLSRYFIVGATVVFRSKFKSLCLPIPIGTVTFIHDRWVAVLIAAVARIDCIEDKLIAYRLHSGQQFGAGKWPPPLNYMIPHRCSSDRAALTRIRERLSDSPWPVKPEFLHALSARQRHIEARCALPRNPLTRFHGVASEYRSGRYGRYAAGVALKDLLVGTR
jgi:glycosyltransferase involved in cell wall biosynthesis